MQLNSHEKQMMDGSYGEAARIAMDILVKMGELYSAERMIPVAQAHIDGCSYAAVWDAGLDFAETLAALGAHVSVPTTLNITARDINHWDQFGVPAEHAEKCRRMEKAYYTMGCIPTWTCAPYQYGLTPAFGQHIAWSESNAVNYANSVLGARSNRNGDLIDICCAIAGRVPEYGLHITKNRAARMIIRFEGLDKKIFADNAAYAAAGYIAGGLAGDVIPVLDGLPLTTSHENLKALSAAAASTGAMGMFHVAGVTPEAPDIQTAIQNNEPEHVYVIDKAQFEQTYQSLTSGTYTGGPALVVVGCPHASYMEIENISVLLSGRKVHPKMEFWIQTNQTVTMLLKHTGIFDSLQNSGVKFLNDGCILNFPMDAWGFKKVVTNSGKMAHYAPGNIKTSLIFTSLAGCVEAACLWEEKA
jgi:predicted aconitase